MVIAAGAHGHVNKPVTFEFAFRIRKDLQKSSRGVSHGSAAGSFYDRRRFPCFILYISVLNGRNKITMSKCGDGRACMRLRSFNTYGRSVAPVPVEYNDMYADDAGMSRPSRLFAVVFRLWDEPQAYWIYRDRS